jgi:arylsulfatase A
MDRRDFFRLGAGFALPQLLRSQASAPRASAPRPNIVFILADDLGRHDLGCYGQTKIKTPNIDRLAEEGMRFNQCYCGGSVCAPSRSTLMTGQHTGHTTIRSNESMRTGRRVSLQADDFTVAEALKTNEWTAAYQEGATYATGMFGKWGLGEPGSTGLPTRHGFDDWFGFLNQQHAHNHYPEYLWRNEQKEILKGNLNGKRREYAQDLFTREAMRFIRMHLYEPFFLYLPYTVPHYRLDVPTLGPYANENWPSDEKTYAAMVTYLDGHVGRIMAMLKETGLDDNTLVFFSSDNGAGWNFPMFNSTGPLRGRKGEIYEGGIRVPMIARWPGKIKAGVVSEQPWAYWDFLPTCAELAGAKPARNIDGISIVPTLLGTGKQRQHRGFYWEDFEAGGFCQAARMGNWKGVRRGIKGPIELYDLVGDPGEAKDVATANPDVVAKMDAYMRSQHADSPEYPVDAGQRNS